jgi:hypothetical protein
MKKVGLNEYFTTFNNRFIARLSSVLAIRRNEIPSEATGISAKYECRVKVEYHKDLMGFLEEGMLLAVRNFKDSRHKGNRFTLLEISRIGPEHYGLKGLSDQAYYPYQFEIIQQSVEDWDTDDKTTMMIQLTAIPLNYDLIINDSSEDDYVKGFTYPVIGEQVYILNKETVHQMYNKTILERMNRSWKKMETSPIAREDPRLGVIKMFESEEEQIPIYVDFERLIRYHFGIFAFTGAGKSNLLSNILRRLLYHTKDTQVVIFDISMEYPFLLQDIFSDPNIPSKIILETPVNSVEQFYKIVVKPRDFEKDLRAKKNFSEILNQGKVGTYMKTASGLVTYEDIFSQLKLLKKENSERATSLEAIDTIEGSIFNYLHEQKLNRENNLNDKFIDYLSTTATATVERYKIWVKSSLYAWATTRDSLKEKLDTFETENLGEGYTTKTIAKLMEDESRFICLSIVDPNLVKSLAVDLSNMVLSSRKKEFKVEPSILFVFDEAQEFIPAYDKARGIEKECTFQVETLLRQGRKYGIGGCIATQRIAYLNTNALQQLHSYFVGPLPRPYDRSLVSNTFTIDQGILEKTLEFAPGEWLLSSYIATGMENVPIFIRADNAEDEVKRFLT